MDITEVIEENYKLKRELEAYSQISLDEIKNLVNTADKMAKLLIRCRNEQINYKLAQEIDLIIEEVEKL